MIRDRAERVIVRGFGPADAARVAFAEAMSADFVACDGRLLGPCSRVQSAIWSGALVAFSEKEDLK